MKCLVTGASGFLGSHLVERLLHDGEEVRAVVRKTSDQSLLREKGAEICYADMKDSATLKEATKGIDIVYHCAALVGDWISREEIFEVNVRGLERLLQASQGTGVKRFVYVSSLAVLGMRHHYDTDETAPYVKTGDNYCDSKIEAENVALRFHKENAFPVTVVRPGFIYGPRDRQFLPRVLDSLKKGQFAFIGEGKKVLNTVYIHNLVDAILLAGRRTNAIGEVFNITDGETVTLKEFIYSIADSLGLQRPTRSIPPFAAKVLCFIMESIATVTRSKKPPLLNRARMKFLYLNQHFSISKARRDLGYNPAIPFQEAISRTLEWVRSQA